MEWIEDFAKLGRENQKNFLRYVLHFLEACIRLHAGLHQLDGKEKDMAVYIEAHLSLDQISRVVDQINDASCHIERNANPKVLMLKVSIEISHLFDDVTQKKSETKVEN